MLKDRRILVNQELTKQKQACGLLYLKIVTNDAEPIEYTMYDNMKAKLFDMISELAIIDQMIADGHK